MKSLPVLLSIALLCGFQDPPAAAPDYAADVKALRSEYQKAEQEFYKLSRAAKTPEERKELKNPAADYLARFKELADKAKGTEPGAAAQFEVFLLAQKVPKNSEDARQALTTLLEKYIGSPLMERVASSMRSAAYTIGEESCRTALETIRDKAPEAKAKAAAIFTLSMQTMPKDAAAARTGFIRLKKEFGDTTYATQADAYLFELDHLQVGMVAPEIEATDEKGVKFKLSDFRGKITLIDFWGFW